MNQLFGSTLKTSNQGLIKTLVSPDKPFIETLLGPNYIEYVILGILGLILFFLLIRELITWYWKINKMVRLLEKIERNTNPETNTEKSKNI